MYKGCRGLMDFVRSPSRSFHVSSGSGRNRPEIGSSPRVSYLPPSLIYRARPGGVLTGEATVRADDTR